jgi:outer membrane protein OmpA-like peptidoglycan-associated protein/uncharacterized protein YegP (UPF0339 family)
MNESIQFRDDDYLSCSSYQSYNPDTSGIHRFENEGKFYFSFIENARVILRSEGYSTETGRENGVASVLKNMVNEDQYVTKQLPDGRWVLSLKALNHQEIARSCPFASEDEVKRFLPSMRKKYSDEMLGLASVTAGSVAQKGVAFAGDGDEEDDYMICREYEEKYSASAADADGFVSFQHENTGKFYFAWYDKNGQVKLRSEGYPTAAARDNGLASVKKNKDTEERWSVEEKRGLHYLVLKAGNHQEIGRSCPHKSADEALGILKAPAVTTVDAVASGGEEDDYMICREYEEKYSASAADADGFVSFQHENTGKFYFAWYDKNGQVKLRSEGYPTAAARDNGLASVKKNKDTEERWSVEEKRGLHYLVLKAGNHQEIGRSCPHKSADEAWGITRAAAVAAPAVAAAAAAIPSVSRDKDDDYLHCDQYKGHQVTDKVNNIAYFKHNDGRLFFVVYNRDGGVKLRSEGFDTVEHRDSELREVIRLMNDQSMYHTIEKAGYRMRVLKDKSGREVGRSCPEKIGAPVAAPVVAAAPAVAPAPVREERKAAAAPVAATGGGFNWWWLLPLLLLIPLFFWWNSCNGSKSDMEATSVTTETPAPAAVAVDTVKAAEPAVTQTTPVEAAKTPDCNLNWILFDFDKYNIRPDADAELQQMAKILKDNPTYTGILKAHTDSKGSDEYNQVLSQNRAKEAKKVLVAAGIEAARIETTASSEAAPIASNTDDDSGRKFNRRVELYVVDANKKEVCKSIPPQVPDSLKGN